MPNQGLKKISFAAALFNVRCPHCREGAIFSSPPYNLAHFRDRHKNCQACGVQFEKEPEFFLGAAYFLYALHVAILFIFGILTLVFLDNPEAWVYVAVTISVVLILFPMNYRFAHSCMIHLFGDFDYQPDPALRNSRGLKR
jgi:uncharacterized protein (DUF983 family)